MAEKAAKKNNKTLIGICLALVAIIVIVVVVVVALKNRPIDDSYFVSDDTKYVLTIDADASYADESAPVKTHLVYYYSGDDVTGLKAYYEFNNAENAKAAYDEYKKIEDQADYKELLLDGKYLIMVANESAYADLSAADVKAQVELMESLKNVNLQEDEEIDAGELLPADEEVVFELDEE